MVFFAVGGFAAALVYGMWYLGGVIDDYLNRPNR